MDYANTLDFYKGKRVLITGNTGFKGSWLTYLLLLTGAKITGYSLKTPTEPSLFEIMELEKFQNLKQNTGDVRDLDALISCFLEAQPEIVIHMAAQPIVRESYKEPVSTYSANVMGTVNVCETIRRTSSVRSFLNITTDKVYKNMEWEYGYRENDELGGLDPYSNSKACSELVTHSYRDAFLSDNGVSVSTARAGNVIGGGDFSADRIIPDCMRALQSDRCIVVRNPHSIRPYQHVLEPLFAYLMIAKKQLENKSYAGSYNIGPDDADCVTTGELVTMFCDRWNSAEGADSLSWTVGVEADEFHEANFLKLDCSKMKRVFGWHPRWNIADSIGYTVDWTRIWKGNGDAISIRAEMDREIKNYISRHNGGGDICSFDHSSLYSFLQRCLCGV